MEQGKRQDWIDRGDDQHLSSGDSDVTAELTNVSLGMAAVVDCSSISSHGRDNGCLELQLCIAPPTTSPWISSPGSETQISCFSVCNYDQDGGKDWLDLSLGRKACDFNPFVSGTSPASQHFLSDNDNELLSLKLFSSSASVHPLEHRNRADNEFARNRSGDGRKDDHLYPSFRDVRLSSGLSTPESLDDFGSILELGSISTTQDRPYSKNGVLRISDRRPPFRSGFWFSLHPASTAVSDHKTFSRDTCGMQSFDKPYIRIRSGDIRVSTVKKYMLAKLGVSSKAAKVVELTCRGKLLEEESTLKNIRDEVWLPQASPDEIVMMLSYKIRDNPL